MNPQELMMLMQNPVQYCISKGFNLPQGSQFNSPKDIVTYLMNSGQASQDAYNQGVKMAQQYGYKI